jgi:glutathione S-transferase
MLLYTCPGGKAAPAVHPCGRAAKALDDAGHVYSRKQVKGGRLILWSLWRRGRDRAEVEQLSGQWAVPILVLDDGEVITGSGAIGRWARANPPQSTVPAS